MDQLGLVVRSMLSAEREHSRARDWKLARKADATPEPAVRRNRLLRMWSVRSRT